MFSKTRSQGGFCVILSSGNKCSFRPIKVEDPNLFAEVTVTEVKKEKVGVFISSSFTDKDTSVAPTGGAESLRCRVILMRDVGKLREVGDIDAIAVFISEGDEGIFEKIKDLGLSARLFHYFVRADLYPSTLKHLLEIRHGFLHVKPVPREHDGLEREIQDSIQHFLESGEIYPPEPRFLTEPQKTY